MKASNLEAEFLTSPQLVLVTLLAIGCILALGAGLFFLPWAITSKTMTLVIGLTVLTLCGLWLLNQHPVIGRWFTILCIALTVHGYGLWLGLPGALAWAVIPVAFATILVGVSAAGITALAESLLVWLVVQYGGQTFAWATLITPLVAIAAI